MTDNYFTMRYRPKASASSPAPIGPAGCRPARRRLDQARARRDQPLQPARLRPLQQRRQHRRLAPHPGRQALGGQHLPQSRKHRPVRPHRDLRDRPQPRQKHQHRLRLRLRAGQRRPPPRRRLPQRPLSPSSATRPTPTPPTPPSPSTTPAPSPRSTPRASPSKARSRACSRKNSRSCAAATTSSPPASPSRPPTTASIGTTPAASTPARPSTPPTTTSARKRLPTADGKLDAADAQRMFPQAHGDAYGHYLTALKGYTRLLHESELHVDAPQRGRHRARPAPSSRLLRRAQIRRGRRQPRPHRAAGHHAHAPPSLQGRSRLRLEPLPRRQGQLLHRRHPPLGPRRVEPARRRAPISTGSRQRDAARQGHRIRSTPACRSSTAPPCRNCCRKLPAMARFPDAMDNANSHLNPLGLSPGAIAFDISPAEFKSGKSHYEQIYDPRPPRRHQRQRRLRPGRPHDAPPAPTRKTNSETPTTPSSTKRRAFEGQLKELYGTPYPGEHRSRQDLRPRLHRPRFLRVVHRRSPRRHRGYVADPTVTVNAKVPTGWPRSPASP
jgi:hypothetical protein